MGASKKLGFCLLGLASTILFAPSVNAQIYGWVESADCTAVHGWAYNTDGGDSAPATIVINTDFHCGFGGCFRFNGTANQFRPDLLAAGNVGNGTHAFTIPIPSDLKDGQPHQLNVTANDGAYMPGFLGPMYVNSTTLQGNPKSIQCVNSPGIPFTKHGNNGTVSCKTFCMGGGSWGQQGNATSAQLMNFPCYQTTGYLENMGEDLCRCINGFGQTFDKPGNNGTVSCDQFCAGSQWGDGTPATQGTCVASNASVVPIDVAPGLIGNASELTCQCQ